MCSRITDTMPATSDGVSPLAWSSTSNAAIWHGSTPSMMVRMAVSACERVRSCLFMSWSMSGLSVAIVDQYSRLRSHVLHHYK